MLFAHEYLHYRYKVGYAKGFAEGLEAGREEGFEEGFRAERARWEDYFKYLEDAMKSCSSQLRAESEIKDRLDRLDRSPK